MKYAVDRRLLLGKAKTISKEKFCSHKVRKQAKLRLALDMYFRFKYMPKKIASILRLNKSDVYYAVRKLKNKASDFIYGMGYDPYSQ